MKWIKRLFKKKPTLREKVVEMYGEYFGELYDKIIRGETIGGYITTAQFCFLVEEARKALEEE